MSKQRFREQKFRKVVKVEVIGGHHNHRIMDEEDWMDKVGLFFLAVPIVGTLMILVYLVAREKEEYYVPIKEVKR